MLNDALLTNVFVAFAPSFLAVHGTADEPEEVPDQDVQSQSF